MYYRGKSDFAKSLRQHDVSFWFFGGYLILTARWHASFDAVPARKKPMSSIPTNTDARRARLEQSARMVLSPLPPPQIPYGTAHRTESIASPLALWAMCLFETKTNPPWIVVFPVRPTPTAWRRPCLVKNCGTDLSKITTSIATHVHGPGQGVLGQTTCGRLQVFFVRYHHYHAIFSPPPPNCPASLTLTV